MSDFGENLTKTMKEHEEMVKKNVEQQKHVDDLNKERETGALMLDTEEKITASKKSTRKKKRYDTPQKKSGDESKEEEHFSFTYNEENLKDEILEDDLITVKKKAGLLDDPSNYLDIGTAYYFNNKKMENLTNYSASLIKRNAFRDKIVQKGEEEYTVTFDNLDEGENEAYKGLPTDKKQLISKYMMKCKLDELRKIEKIVYPFLDNN